MTLIEGKTEYKACFDLIYFQTPQSVHGKILISFFQKQSSNLKSKDVVSEWTDAKVNWRKNRRDWLNKVIIDDKLHHNLQNNDVLKIVHVSYLLCQKVLNDKINNFSDVVSSTVSISLVCNFIVAKLEKFCFV